jgi:hypothetical protein
MKVPIIATLSGFVFGLMSTITRQLETTLSSSTFQQVMHQSELAACPIDPRPLARQQAGGAAPSVPGLTDAMKE